MAGHSKWANIQHRKNTQDAKRGKLFTRLIRETTVAARMGGGDPNMNPRLRLAMDKALAANMPRDTIERAAKRGAGALDGMEYEENRYEGYGPGGVAVIVDTMTDNRNRTVAEVRHAFSKYGGNLGASGSVAFQFAEQGVLSYPPGSDEESVAWPAHGEGAGPVRGRPVVQRRAGAFARPFHGAEGLPRPLRPVRPEVRAFRRHARRGRRG